MVVFREFCTSLQKSFLHVAYPTKCLHCACLLPPDGTVLCPACTSLLDLIHAGERCPTCFDSLTGEASVCEECADVPSLYLRMAAAFQYEGAAATLVKRLKYGNQPTLAKGMAAYMVLQMDQLGWPMPDALIPVPLSLSRLLERSYNQSALIATEMGALLQLPVWPALKRKSGDFSQAALSLENRKILSGKSFKPDSRYELEGKTLLVIDDVMTSGSTLRRCAETLEKSYPSALYAMCFCRA